MIWGILDLRIYWIGSAVSNGRMSPNKQWFCICSVTVSTYDAIKICISINIFTLLIRYKSYNPAKGVRHIVSALSQTPHKMFAFQVHYQTYLPNIREKSLSKNWHPRLKRNYFIEMRNITFRMLCLSILGIQACFMYVCITLLL